VLVVLAILAASVAFAAEPIEVFPGNARDLAAGLPAAEYIATPLPDEAYGEGWFYMARLDDGTFLFCNFFLTNIGLGSRKADVTVNVNYPDGTRVADRGEFKSDGLTLGTDRFFVRIGESEISGTFPDFKVRLRLSKITADLTYRAELPGWMPGSGMVYYGPGRGKFYKYRATIPRALVTGTLAAGGRKASVRGYGYSDHGTTNMYPHQYAARWHSLRSFDARWTVQYLEFDTPEKYGKRRVGVILVGKDGKILHAGPNLALTKEDLVTDATGYAYPKRLRFSSEGPGAKVQGTVAVTGPVESIDLLAQLKPFERLVAKMFAKSFIFRQRDKVDATVTTPAGEEKITLPGVNEVLFVR
jgi:hypothetical protein